MPTYLCRVCCVGAGTNILSKPEPRDKDHSFNYDREVWRSMPNMDLEDEYVKHFSRRQGHRFRRMPIGMIQAWKEKLTGKDNTRFLRDMIESAKANETTKPLIFLAVCRLLKRCTRSIPQSRADTLPTSHPRFSLLISTPRTTGPAWSKY